jgi:hypothetical protein
MPSLFGDSSAFDTKAIQQGYFGARLKLYLRMRNIKQHRKLEQQATLLSRGVPILS